MEPKKTMMIDITSYNCSFYWIGRFGRPMIFHCLLFRAISIVTIMNHGEESQETKQTE